MDLARVFRKAAHVYHITRDVHDAMTNQKPPSKERRHQRRRSCTFKTADQCWSSYRHKFCSFVLPTQKHYSVLAQGDYGDRHIKRHRWRIGGKAACGVDTGGRVSPRKSRTAICVLHNSFGTPPITRDAFTTLTPGNTGKQRDAAVTTHIIDINCVILLLYNFPEQISLHVDIWRHSVTGVVVYSGFFASS